MTTAETEKSADKSPDADAAAAAKAPTESDAAPTTSALGKPEDERADDKTESAPATSPHGSESLPIPPAPSTKNMAASAPASEPAPDSIEARKAKRRLAAQTLIGVAPPASKSPNAGKGSGATTAVAVPPAAPSSRPNAQAGAIDTATLEDAPLTIPKAPQSAPTVEPAPPTTRMSNAPPLPVPAASSSSALASSSTDPEPRRESSTKQKTAAAAASAFESVRMAIAGGLGNQALPSEKEGKTAAVEFDSAADRMKSAPALNELAEKATEEIEARILEAKEAKAAKATSDSSLAVAKSSSRNEPVAARASDQLAALGLPPEVVKAPSQRNVAAEPSDARPLAAYELLARSARLGDLVAIANRVITEAAASRITSWHFTSKVLSAAEEHKLTREDADTRFGNALDVLGTGGEGAAEKSLACALWAHAVAESPKKTPEDENRLAGDILWLATHTPFDATPLLDRALGEEAADLWTAIADRVRRIERGKGGALGRGEAIVGCAALAGSGADRAKALCVELTKEVKDPVLLRVLATGDHAMPEEVRLEGEMLPTPRGPVATTLLAFTGILFAVHVVRLTARLALAYKRPAEVSFSESGIRVKTRTELLGRTLREREHVILRTGLVRVVREVRFPRAAFYAGLFALALGSYIGVRAFADGVRAASPSLLVVGLLIVAIGIGADFVLGTLIPGTRGRCRVAFVPRTGPTLCVGNVDSKRADDALTRSLRR